MLFDFIKYLQPTHYFGLLNTSGNSIFPFVEALPEQVREVLCEDTRYQSDVAIAYDLSWQALQLGYIGATPTYSTFDTLSVKDNYHFIRKYFNKAWVLYVFVLRLCSLHNPVTEFQGFFGTRQIKRKRQTDYITYPEWSQFQSSLIASAPKVSVIIPTLNRYAHLKEVLLDFEQQDYSNFEVIIVDQSQPFKPEFYDDFNLDIHLIRQEEPALWLARNTAIKNSKAEIIALSEDDVRVKKDWISMHLKCLDFFGVQVSAGVFYPEGKQIPSDRSFFSMASQFATGNAMLYKEVFKKVGLFDRQFEKQRMGDGEFGMRVYLEGILSVSNPMASCVDVKAGTGGLREMGSWDAFRPSNFFAPRPIPSVLYYFRTYYGKKKTRFALLRTVPLSIFPYQFKKNKPLLILGVFLSILILPLMCYQVLRSWQLASKKLAQGPLIETLS